MKKIMIIELLIVLVAGAAQAGVLEPGLADHMDGLADNEILKVLVVMDDPTDIRLMDKNFHQARTKRADRNRAVVTTLRQAAEVAQADLIGDLDSRVRNKGQGGVLGFTPHWIINAVVVVADVATIREIAVRPDVDIVEADLPVELIEPVMTKESLRPSGASNSKQDPFVAPGVIAVNAQRVWHELGYTGAGTLVGNMDSGVDASHPLLSDRWRGNRVPVSHAWRDHANAGTPNYPTDQNGHGTHTMGTITGASASDTVGVAPGAEWIASNAIYAQFNSLDNAVIAGFEFFADPDGNPSTSDDVPDVVQNSWGIQENVVVGYLACDSRWWDVIDNCESAGVVVVFSAGNEGPQPQTLRSPGNRATTPTNCFSVGSVGNSQPYSVSSFSSRGPSQCGGVHQIKPEVVGPGENIISCAPNNAFTAMSGTSMAGPHIAGIVALMREANPDLDVITIKEILMDTAVDVGSPGEDNSSGWGMVDAYAAVLAAINDVGAVEGTVVDAATGLPLAGAEVTRSAYGFRGLTDSAGEFRFGTRPGVVDLEFRNFGYYPETASGNLLQGEILILDAALTPFPKGTVSGTVYGPDGDPVAGATVMAKDIAIAPVVTDPAGSYHLALPLVEDFGYTISVSAQDHAYEISFIGLTGDRDLDFHLPYVIAEGFESGTLTSFPWQHGGDAPMGLDLTEAHEGQYSLRSAAVDDGESSEIWLDYYVNGEGDLSFWVKTDSEEGYDGLLFYVDGVLIETWSGETPWTQFSTTLSSGHRNLRWQFAKDYGVAYGRDAVWIDRIEFPGTGVQPIPAIMVDPTSLSATLAPGQEQTEILQVSNVGGYRLDFAAGATPSWASAAPDTGWVHPGVSRDLAITFDAGDLAAGTYQAVLTIASNDLQAPFKTVPLVMTVGQVSTVDDVPAPGDVELIGAVPNPFNPMTHISYRLPHAGPVSLNIYDVSGRLVRELAAGLRDAGLHRERWDGRDTAGQAVSSGVYFARLRVGAEIHLRQMLLLR